MGEKYLGKKKKYLFLAKMLNPFVLILYGIFCFYLYSLSQYGGLKRKAPIIIVSMILLIFWFLWCFYRKLKMARVVLEDKEELEPIENMSNYSKKMSLSKVWFFIAFYTLIIMTSITGIKIYQSSIPYNGKLSWFIQDLKNKRQISFVKNNIYESGIEGIFDDIESKIQLPEDLYLSSDFKLEFRKDGTITSFDTYVYGKNGKDQIESFLISYDERKSEKIIVYLSGYVEADFNEKKKLQPLKEILQRISLKDTVSQWNEDKFEVFYSGVRNWGYNTEGIIYVDENENAWNEDNTTREIIGYTVSVYVPGKEDLYPPNRFIYEGDNAFSGNPADNKDDNNEWEVGYNYKEGEETFFINKNLGYQLSVVDAALGSRFYALLQTRDGGENWETINEDPYLNHTGVSAGITFIDESLGFIALSHSGAIQADLYRTTDGGLSYEEVSLPTIQVPLVEGQVQEPFDFPEMPYKEDERLLVLVGQGQDGDYKSGIQALYQSKDNGKTWAFVKEK